MLALSTPHLHRGENACSTYVANCLIHFSTFLFFLIFFFQIVKFQRDRETRHSSSDKVCSCALILPSPVIPCQCLHPTYNEKMSIWDLSELIPPAFLFARWWYKPTSVCQFAKNVDLVRRPTRGLLVIWTYSGSTSPSTLFFIGNYVA